MAFLTPDPTGQLQMQIWSYRILRGEGIRGAVRSEGQSSMHCKYGLEAQRAGKELGKGERKQNGAGLMAGGCAAEAEVRPEPC